MNVTTTLRSDAYPTHPHLFDRLSAKPEAACREDWTDTALLLIAAVGALLLTVAILNASAIVLLFMPIFFFTSTSAALLGGYRYQDHLLFVSRPSSRISY